MGDFLDQVRSVVGAGQSESGPESDREERRDGEGTDAEACLFECPTCERVFIDTEKRICSECDAEVELVWGA